MDLSEERGSQRRHPWETARARAVQRMLRDARVEPTAILDFGCGDGFTGEQIVSAFGATRHFGFDLHLTDEQCRARSAGRIRYANDWQGADGERFDLCLMCDVIEHVEDERVVLDLVRPRLTPDAHLLVTVPAYQGLFTSHDVALRHYRRYTLPQLEQVLTANGFDLVSSGYLFASLLPSRGLQKLLETLKPPADDASFGIGGWNGSAALTRVVEGALDLDNSTLLGLARRGIKLPGLSTWALCKKRPS